MDVAPCTAFTPRGVWNPRISQGNPRRVSRSSNPCCKTHNLSCPGSLFSNNILNSFPRLTLQAPRFRCNRPKLSAAVHAEEEMARARQSFSLELKANAGETWSCKHWHHIRAFLHPSGQTSSFFYFQICSISRTPAPCIWDLPGGCHSLAKLAVAAPCPNRMTSLVSSLSV